MSISTANLKIHAVQCKGYANADGDQCFAEGHQVSFLVSKSALGSAKRCPACQKESTKAANKIRNRERSHKKSIETVNAQIIKAKETINGDRFDTLPDDQKVALKQELSRLEKLHTSLMIGA